MGLLDEDFVRHVCGLEFQKWKAMWREEVVVWLKMRTW
jgi:hypothetical protein